MAVKAISHHFNLVGIPALYREPRLVYFTFTRLCNISYRHLRLPFITRPIFLSISIHTSRVMGLNPSLYHVFLWIYGVFSSLYSSNTENNEILRVFSLIMRLFTAVTMTIVLARNFIAFGSSKQVIQTAVLCRVWTLLRAPRSLSVVFNTVVFIEPCSKAITLPSRVQSVSTFSAAYYPDFDRTI